MAIREKKILKVKKLKKYFPVKKGIFKKTVAYVKAVDDISFDIYEGETLGLVGESGCGKSTTGSTILRLLEATSGEVIFQDEDILSLDNNKKLRTIRKDMQMIFQDPYASLNPRMTVADIVGEPLKVHKIYKNKSDRDKKVIKLLENVGLTAEQMNRYPHEFSGGQRQRIGVARALALDPKLIIADEPVSALDVSVQAQVINIMQELQNKFGLTYLFIAHDLSVVKHISDRVAVMYLGKIVEITDKRELYDNPLHPYTQALLSAIPEPNPERKKERVILEGDVPSPIDPPSGCSFHPRCPVAMDICSKVEPEFKDYGNEHFASCHLLD